ncbi:hypothetical protein [Microbacterium sp. SSM24]|uniref:hypothetical protein n=1 Tax=Microbacterium sp. SSM24 TaxID=2991714 RepID=UPI0022268B3A|nr:hypothetical protein [Microbacterium sp. SSM24]MCW3494226.1 hypothetical protein [Microbacterium sp. SSM24]
MTIVMEPLVIRGRRPAVVDAGAVDAEPASARAGPGLTNRAAGRLRDAPDRARFGGFSYTRTAQDDAEARAALARALRPAPAGPTETAPPGDAAATGSGATTRARFGGFAYERTTQDDSEVAATAERERALLASADAVDAPGASGEQPVPAASSEPTAADVVEVDSTETREVTGDETTASVGAASAAMAASVAAAAPASLAGIETPAALVTAARVAADSLPRPDVPRAPLDRVFAPMIATAGRRAARPAARGGGGRYPPPRPAEPIEIDPVPQATSTLSTALNERLPELALPAVRAMPDGTVPTLGEVSSISADELAVEVDTASPAADAAAANRTEASRRSAALRTTPDASVPPPVPRPISPPVLVDFRRPPPPPPPRADAELESSQIARVLALIMADIPDRVTTAVDRVRGLAFPPNKLANYYLDVTDPWKPVITTGINAKIEELRAAANITPEILNRAVEARRAEIATRATRVTTAAELEVDRTARTLTREAERENARIEQQRLRDQARQVARYRRALYSRDPALVEELAAARIGYIDADVGRGTAAIDAAKTRRLELLTSYTATYREAYRRADDAFQHPTGGPARAPPNEGTRLWYDVAVDALTTAMTGLRTQTETDAGTLATNLRNAGTAAKAAVRTWSDTRLRRHLSDDERARRSTADADVTNTAITNARAEAARNTTRERLMSDIRVASATYLRTLDDAAGVTREHAINLNDAQLEMGRRFLAMGEPGDPMSAVANVLIERHLTETFGVNFATKVEELRTAIYAKSAATPEEAGELGDIYFPGGGGGLEARVNRLWTAFEVWHGTAEEDAIKELEGLDYHQTALLNRAYFLIKNQSLQWRIGEEMSGSDFDKAQGLAQGDDEGRRRHVRGVIADADGWFSNDPAAALDAVRNLPPGQADALVADPATRAHLTEVLGGRRWVDRRGSVADDRGERELQLLVQLNRPADATDPTDAATRRDLQARADAIEFDRAVRRGSGGEASTEAVVERIRRSVTASAPPTWSHDEIDNEVRRRMRAMENAYEVEFGSELPSGGVSALRTAVARYSYGTTLDLRQSLLDVDRARERSSRLQRTTEGFYTSDSELNAELTRTYNDALAEVRRNETRQDSVRREAEHLMTQDGIRAPPAPSVLAAYRQEAEENLARTLAAEWMGSVRTAFAADYGRRWGGGSDPLRDMVTSQTQFAGETEALARLDTGGGLTPARAVEIGQAGWGMDRELVMAGLGNRTTQQLARISAEYRTNESTAGRDMLADLRSETGGWTDETADRNLERDAFDIREAMRGVPTTPREEHESARRRFEYERDVYFGGTSDRPDAVTNEFASLRRQMDRVDARMRDWNAARDRGDTAALRRIESGLATARESVGVSADAYRRAVDDHVEGIAQKVAIGVALAVVGIVAIVTSIATGGLAAPAWVAVATAVAASLAGTAASMAVKNSMLGAAYGQNAFRTDLLVGAVDAIVAALTAGLADKILKLPRLAGATPAARTMMARAIAAQRASRPLLARMGAFTVEQIAQSVPTALTGAALNRDTWKGDPLRNFALAGATAAGMGIGMGAAMHVTMTHAPRLLTGIADTARLLTGRGGAAVTGESVVLRSTRQAVAVGDVEAATNRGSFLERWAARRQFLRANPGASELDFQVALAQGAADAKIDAGAVRSLQVEMKGHLVSGLNGSDAELARQARIEVLSDAEFVRRTGSESNGYAATLNVKGEPVVVIREGAPLTRLAEEGRHVAQFFDPANAARLALVDERRLAAYASMSLTDRIAAWRAKIDLELDVQARTIPELRAQLNDPGLHPDRLRDLARMLIEAETAVEVLSARRVTLDGFGSAEIARMRAGDLSPPRFLDDPPRLFAKSTDADAPAVDTTPASPAVKPAPSDATAAPVPAETETWTRGGRAFVAEPHFLDGSRRSRYVIVREGGEIVEVILQRKEGKEWRLSGRVGRDRGGVAEFAARIEHMAAAAAEESATVSLRQLGAQTGTGAGLDDLWFRFDTSGGAVECRARVYEAKHYDGQVSSFSAIDENFRTNIKRARDRLQLHLNRGTWDEAGMTRAQVEAALRALDRNQIDVIVRTSGTTRVNPDHLSDIGTRLNRRKSGAPIRVLHDPNPIGSAAMLDAEELWLRVERFRRRGYKDADNILFKDLANGPRGMDARSVDRAEAVVTARNLPGSQLSGRIEWAPGRGHLVDANGPFKVLVAERPPAGMAFQADVRARAILSAVEAGVPATGGRPSVEPVRVVVDYSALTVQQARELRAALAAIAKSSGRSDAADRIMWVPPLRSLDSPTGSK